MWATEPPPMIKTSLSPAFGKSQCMSDHLFSKPCISALTCLLMSDTLEKKGFHLQVWYVTQSQTDLCKTVPSCLSEAIDFAGINQSFMHHSLMHYYLIWCIFFVLKWIHFFHHQSSQSPCHYPERVVYSWVIFQFQTEHLHLLTNCIPCGEESYCSGQQEFVHNMQSYFVPWIRFNRPQFAFSNTNAEWAQSGLHLQYCILNEFFDGKKKKPLTLVIWPLEWGVSPYYMTYSWHNLQMF